jgi:putative membrane protein
MRAVVFTSVSNLLPGKLLRGALAGFIATAPMSLCMLLGWNLLPKREKYHLPPRLITEESTERVGLEDHMNEKELVGLTILSQFGYGAVFGATYALFEHRVPVFSSLKGVLAGPAVWLGSYLGWLPVTGILSPATDIPGAGTC